MDGREEEYTECSFLATGGESEATPQILIPIRDDFWLPLFYI
jgi:hypothetical protein